MNLVTTYSNWCYIDQLDGINLFDGERLRVRWPAGVVEEVEVHIEESTLQTHDQGSATSIPIQRAYTEIPHHGTVAKLYLKDQEAERVRPPKHKVGEIVTVADYPGAEFRVSEVRYTRFASQPLPEGWLYHLSQQPYKTEKPSITSLQNPISEWRPESAIS